MKTIKYILIAALFSILCVAPDLALAGSSCEAELDAMLAAEAERGRAETDFAHHTMYINASSMIAATSTALHYEYRPVKWFGVSVGFGGGDYTVFDTPIIATELMLNFMTTGDHKFIGGVGVGAAWAFGVIEDCETGEKCEYYNSETPTSEYVLPAVMLGYRYQPAAGGLFAEAGIGMRNSAPGFNVGFGATF